MATDKTPTLPTNLEAAPVVVSGKPSDVDPHKLPPADASFAGQYKITLGTIRIGDVFYGEGAVLSLSAADGKNMSDLGVVERL